MEKANAVIERLCIFEADFKLQKQEFKDKLNINPISHPQLDTQINVWSKQMMISFKRVLGEVLVYFAYDNEDVNGYAKDVNEMVIRNLVGNPEENLTNLLMGTEEEEEDGNLPDGGGLANLREVKVEEVYQNSTEVVLPSNSDNHDLNQLLSSSHPINQGSTDLALSQLDSTQTQSAQLVAPVLQQQNVNNAIQQPANHKKKRTMWKKLSIQPSHCMVKGCGKAYDYERIRSNHIEKHHKKTRYWPCDKCSEQFPDYSQLSDHYFREHLDQFQCTFPDCGFTSKTARQVSLHFEEQHKDVADLVDNSEGDHTNPDTDEDAEMSEHETNSENAQDNAQPITQSSRDVLQSSVASNPDSNIRSVNVAQKPSTSAESNTLKRSSPEPRNDEECNRVDVTGQGQEFTEDGEDHSSTSVKKAKFDEPKETSNPQKSQKYEIISGSKPGRRAATCSITNCIEEANEVIRTVKKKLTIVNRIGLKCFQCQRLFPTDKELNDHMWKEHHIRAFSCLVKDCGQSFDTKYLRKLHTGKVHHFKFSPNFFSRKVDNNMQLRCAKCPQDFGIYSRLTEHYLTVHSARYECAFPNCKFKCHLINDTSRHYFKKHLNWKFNNICDGLRAKIVKKVYQKNSDHNWLVRLRSIVDNPEENKSLRKGGDLSENLSNSEENVQPINQDSTGVLQSPLAQPSSGDH